MLEKILDALHHPTYGPTIVILGTLVVIALCWVALKAIA